MDKKEILEIAKSKYAELKSAGKLNNRQQRHTDPLNAFNFSLAKEILNAHLKNGKTVVPIDLKSFWTANGNQMDFNHVKDKIRRYFEIVVLHEIKPSEMDNIRGIYGIETTNTLRKYFQPGKHFTCESNPEMQECFLNIDISEYLAK